jgi:large subunit ribosomal protein L31e
MADKTTQELERIYTIPLREVKSSPRNHQADRAIRAVKRYLAKHMKSEDIWIDASVNEKIWARGMYTIPSKIRVRARKFDDGVVEVSLPEVEAKASIRSEIKARKEKKDEEKKKEKKEEEKEEGESEEEAEKKTAEGSEKEKPASGEKPKTAAKPEPKKTGEATKAASQATPATKKEAGKPEKA